MSSPQRRDPQICLSDGGRGRGAPVTNLEVAAEI